MHFCDICKQEDYANDMDSDDDYCIQCTINYFKICIICNNDKRMRWYKEGSHDKPNHICDKCSKALVSSVSKKGYLYVYTQCDCCYEQVSEFIRYKDRDICKDCLELSE